MMSDEEFTEEHLLEEIYDAMLVPTDPFHGYTGEWYGTRPDLPRPALYFTDPNGVCWHVTATPHKHEVHPNDLPEPS